MRSHAQQKAALTVAVKSGSPDRVSEETMRTIREWNETHWPDDWSNWQRAVFDVCGIDAWFEMEAETS